LTKVRDLSLLVCYREGLGLQDFDTRLGAEDLQ
jgi:hypothetical protein